MVSAGRTTAYGQLLLCAALLFGIFTMHTVGHPAEHSAGAGEHAPMAAGEHAPAAMTMAAPASVTAGHHQAAAPRHEPPLGMDPGSVCLAVLGVWRLALLAIRLLSARGRTPDASAARGRTLRPPWPNPPPPYGSSVAALSVLRQ
ncbi:hypothetical protein A8W25_08015 [Streptomyces sp. ERV7]|uniref:DUF6153 family protein n=1 Tax=Streptomyces sp. ERV7 TaxID=1322334 RepID=UPI0007F4E484|nr:DUF6153 family protein [Streptomyces sp. ERV7]OAR25540.1 hypothetical protein A8W25_08015 [Streptomyces sp. ERV7]